MQEIIIMKINWKFEETALQRNIIRDLSPLHAERLFEWKVKLQRKHENNYEILSSSKIYTKNWKTQNCERTKLISTDIGILLRIYICNSLTCTES